jgi:hypothetical protein
LAGKEKELPEMVDGKEKELPERMEILAGEFIVKVAEDIRDSGPYRMSRIWW